MSQLYFSSPYVVMRIKFCAVYTHTNTPLSPLHACICKKSSEWKDIVMLTYVFTNVYTDIYIYISGS